MGRLAQRTAAESYGGPKNGSKIWLIRLIRLPTWESPPSITYPFRRIARSWLRTAQIGVVAWSSEVRAMWRGGGDGREMGV